MSESSNPFSDLVEARTKTESSGGTARVVNTLIENIFHFTISQESLNGAQQLVLLEDLQAAEKPSTVIDLNNLDQALFERVLIPKPETFLAPRHRQNPNPNVIESRTFIYLYNSWNNLHNLSDSSNEIFVNAERRMQELILRNAVTALKQPVLFEGQNFTKQMLDILMNPEETATDFFVAVVNAFMNDEGGSDFNMLKETFKPVFQELASEITIKYDLINLPLHIVPMTLKFSSNPHLAQLLIDVSSPREITGRYFQDCLLGSLLNLSPLPKNVMSRLNFFTSPTDQAAVRIMETTLWNSTKHLSENLHKIFLTLLKISPDMKKRTCQWIGLCLKANKQRGQLWNVQGGNMTPEAMNSVSDGFMLNLGTVMLRLCEPFCSTYDDPKSLKIDPTYCAVPEEECEGRSVHMTFLHQETCLLPPKEDVARKTAPTYNFLTECFFLAHKCIDIGLRVCTEKLFRLNQDIGPMQQALENVENAELLESMRRRLEPFLSRYISLWCAITEPNALSLLCKLDAVTCNWLVQLAVHPDGEDKTTYAPITQLPIEMPITVPVPDTLRCVPEFVLENVVVLISLVRRSPPDRNVNFISDAELSALFPPTLTLVLTYMGDRSRCNNPHLRARLAECLEAMLPDSATSSLATFYRDQLFKKHPHRHELVRCLLDVFVGIEMTGQSVQFEQKFNYRRPMYIVMDFLWEIQEHKDSFTKLAREAEANMEAVQPPLFLRFVNLLMNDAIFLLDEALSNIAQIRTMQAQQDAGEWNSMSAEERGHRMRDYNHIGMLARFDNILGRDTVGTLVRMTAHAPYIFCHATLVDRVAAMLNYYLLNLTGPNSKNFKVRDNHKYQFNPAQTVLDICRMYVQLGESSRFCAAVSDDGRSYSPALFARARDVLARIGGGSLIASLDEVAARIASVSQQRQADEDLLANAPDDFLDPIMSTLMLDPVTLPSSRINIDRTTIARHLLSDQSDPFNRSPLTMDQVKPNDELRDRIHRWIAERKGEQASSSSA